MKFAKKMLMVPEAEYYALLNAMNSGDYLQNEKAMMDAKIAQNLRDENITEDLKSKRHDWLYKERRMLKELIDNRPQKVVIENQLPPPNIAPYLGLTNQTSIKETDEPRKFIIPRKRLKPNTPEPDPKETTPEPELQTPPHDEMSPFFSTPELVPRSSIIHPTLLKDLFTYVNNHKDSFKITAAGKILSNKNLPIEESDYKDVLKYLTGQKDETPRGAKFLKDRLLKDKKVNELIEKSNLMWGRGKKLKRNSIKTPGIKRETKPFRPLIWAKL